MDTKTEKLQIAVYFRYPKAPVDESVIEQRLDAMTSAVSAGNDRELVEVYTDIGISADKDNPFPGFAQMQQDYNDGKFSAILTEPPHSAYREIDAGMDYLLELRGIGAHIIFTNGQTLAELLAISIFRSTMQALTLVSSMAVQEMALLLGDDPQEAEQPVMPF